MTLPTWLKGRVGSPTKRGVTSHRCKLCKAQILTGLDEDQCAFHADVDPACLTALGEALARLADRYTYELRPRAAGFALWRRDRWQIVGRPAGQKFLVVADHLCNSPPLPAIPQPTVTTYSRVGVNDDPPF